MMVITIIHSHAMWDNAQAQWMVYISHLVTTMILSHYRRIQYKQKFISFLKTQDGNHLQQTITIQ